MLGSLAVVAALAVSAPPNVFCHEVRARIDVVRHHEGIVGDLARSDRLSAAATLWAHRNPTKHGHWIRRLRSAGVTKPDLGEVIAWGQQTPGEVVADWMHSPKHRRVLLEPSTFFQADGVGCHWSGTEWFTVADFAGYALSGGR